MFPGIVNSNENSGSQMIVKTEATTGKVGNFKIFYDGKFYANRKI